VRGTESLATCSRSAVCSRSIVDYIRPHIMARHKTGPRENRAVRTGPPCLRDQSDEFVRLEEMRFESGKFTASVRTKRLAFLPAQESGTRLS